MDVTEQVGYEKVNPCSLPEGVFNWLEGSQSKISTKAAEWVAHKRVAQRVCNLAQPIPLLYW